MNVQHAFDILGSAYSAHSPSHVFVLLSGGHDSRTTLHVALRWWHMHRQRKRAVKPLTAVHIDTGIAVPETQLSVINLCKYYRVPLLIYRAVDNAKADGTPDPQVYEQIVLEHGFPGKAQHGMMYIRLKERQVKRLVRNHKTHYHDRIMLISGVREQESDRRAEMIVADIQRKGAFLWVAPLIDWTAIDCTKYMSRWNIPRNPANDKIHMSGECLCGAYADKHEKQQIDMWYPDVGEYLDWLSNRVNDAGMPWKWHEGPPNWWKAYQDDVQPFFGETFMPLCMQCEHNRR